MPVVNDYTALLGGDYWNGIEVTGKPIVVTFSFPTVAPAYDSSAPGFTTTTSSTFTPFNAAEQAQALNALGQWASASGIVFVQVAPGLGDINFQNVNFSTTSYGSAGGVGFYPFGPWSGYSYPSYSGDLTVSGDVFMNTQYQNPDGTVNLGTLLHEIGHAIGLKHPTEVVNDYIGNVNHDAVLATDSASQTIMAQTVDPNPATANQLKTLDQQAAAFLYGPAGTGGVYTASASGVNSVSNWSWDVTTQTLTQHAVAANEVIHGTSVDDVIYALSGNNSLFGLAGNNKLYAGSGDDKLYDGPGTNLLTGGVGDDSFYVTNAATTIVVNSTTGNDAVYATVSYTLPTNVNTLYLSGTGLTGTGNSQTDSIFGDGTYASTLIAGTGNTYMVGGAGNDIIKAGSGIDRMFGGGGVNTFVFGSALDGQINRTLTSIGDFVSGKDKIDLSAIKGSGGVGLYFSNSPMFSGTAGEVHARQVGGQTYLEADLTGSGGATFQIAFDNSINGPIPIQASDVYLVTQCYARGTRILTARGEVAIEELGLDDLVVTVSGARRPVVWTGGRSIDILRHPDPGAVRPVRVSANAFGQGAPKRDLLLSPGHNIAWDGALMPISSLINGVSVMEVDQDRVEYWHVELDAHDVIFADGLAAESYLDTGYRAAFDNCAAFIEAHPDFKPKHWAATCLPLVSSGPQVESARLRLRAPLLARGYALTREAGAYLQADGKRVDPLQVSQTRLTFLAPAGAQALKLVSHVFVPRHTMEGSHDRRQLGLCVARLQIDGTDLPLDGIEAEGWHEPESDQGVFTHRWTSGAAPLPPGGRFIVVDLAGQGLYWREPENEAVALSA